MARTPTKRSAGSTISTTGKTARATNTRRGRTVTTKPKPAEQKKKEDLKKSPRTIAPINITNRLKKTVRYAPDARVRFNKTFELPMCPHCQCAKVTADTLLSSFTTSLNVDSVPGSASLTFIAGRNQRNRLFQGDETLIKEMDEVEIFVKSNIDYRRYYRVFHGIVTSIGVDESQDVLTLSIDCQDVLRLWELTKIIFTQGTNTLVYQDRRQAFGVVMRKQFNKNVFEWFTELATTTMAESHIADSYININTREGSIKAGPDGVKGHNWRKYWQDTLRKIANRFLIFGYNGVVAGKTENGKKIISPGVADYRYGVDVLASASNYQPFLSDAASKTIDTQAEMKSYLELALQLKDAIHWEFFMDSTGDIVLKPPLYNLDTRQFAPYVIEDIDIVSKSLGHGESEIITGLVVTGNTDFMNPDIAPKGVAYDRSLTARYGIRELGDRNVPYLRTLDGVLAYAVSELDRINAQRYEGSLSIMGRPELRLGFPVYVRSLDTFLYVTGINHSFTFGGSFKTTINYKGKRSKYKPVDPSLFTKTDDGILRNVMLVDDTGTSITAASQIKNTTEPVDAQQTKVKDTTKDVTDDELKQNESVEGTVKKDVVRKQLHTSVMSSKFSLAGPSAMDYVSTEAETASRKEESRQYAYKTTGVGTVWKETVQTANVWTTLNAGNFLNNLEKNQPASDAEGYEIIGCFPYGGTSYITSKGEIKILGTDKQLTVTAYETAEKMKPKTADSEPPVEPVTTHITLAEMPQEVTRKGKKDKAAEMKPEEKDPVTKEPECECACHKLDYRTGHFNESQGDKING